MEPMPTEPVWDVQGRDPSGNVKHFERFKSREKAMVRLRELKESGAKGLEYSISERESIVPDRTMPTEEQRRDLCDLMHWGFVALRNLGYAKKHEAIVELADVLHNLPQEMFRKEVWDWNLLEAGFRDFEEKHPDDGIFPFAAKLREIRGKAP